MQNFGHIENGSIFRIFGSVRALALKISHRDYFEWIPRTHISVDAKFWIMKDHEFLTRHILSIQLHTMLGVRDCQHTLDKVEENS